MWKFTLITVLGLLAIIVLTVGALFGAVSILDSLTNGIGLAITAVTMAVVVGGGALRARRRHTPYW